MQLFRYGWFPSVFSQRRSKTDNGTLLNIISIITSTLEALSLEAFHLFSATPILRYRCGTAAGPVHCTVGALFCSGNGSVPHQDRPDKPLFRASLIARPVSQARPNTVLPGPAWPRSNDNHRGTFHFSTRVTDGHKFLSSTDLKVNSGVKYKNNSSNSKWQTTGT